MMISGISPINAIPPQMLSYKEKIKNKKQWGKDTVDALEKIGRRQCMENMRFSENYQMVNGKFIWQHYFEQEAGADWLTMLTREFEIPSTLRHYDIIGKVLTNLTEKLQEFPDVFRVEEQFEEDQNNEYVRTQTRLMHEAIKAEISAEITQNLMAQGIDPSKQDFQSEEEAMQYFEEVQKMSQAMTPPQIQKYMNTEWQSQGEIWGMHQLQVDKQQFKLHELERKEFRDMLITDRCFRHFFITGTGYMQETWNPINTFFHVSPDVDWVEDGNYAGRITYMTKADIIERYGWKLKDKDLQKLEDIDKKHDGKNDLSGFPYNVYAPFEDYKSYVQISQNTGYDPINRIPVMQNDTLMSLTSNNKLNYADYGFGLYRTTEVYWKSQKKIGKYVYIDEFTGELTKDIVDENFFVPEGVVEKKGDFFDGDNINTVYWTQCNQVWKCTKISSSFDDTEAIYLDLTPCEFQFKGDYNPYGCKLPICGRIFNNRNAQSMSLVDFMKPHQIGYNVAMNQLYQLMEKETGVFMVWDANFFNTMKDWGGEDSWDKVAMIAKELGHVFGDTSPQSMKGANPGNQLPKVINMELTAQMFSRAKLADFFELKALSQLGISPQMMSEVGANETLGGIKTAVNQAQLNIQRFYSDFFEYKQHCLTMALDISQFVQSEKRDVTIMYTKSDASRQFIKLTGIELLLRNMHVYVVNSQELLRQMEAIRNWFLTNNTSNVDGLDVLEVIKSNSPAAIQAKLEESMQRKNAKEQQLMEQQNKQIEQTGQIAQMKEERLDARNTENNETKKEVAFISSFNRQPDNMKDSNSDNVPDVLEYNKFSELSATNQSKLQIQKEANDIKRSKVSTDRLLKQRELDIKEKTLKQKEKESKNAVRIAKINK